jgi:hypothetical protein
MGVRDISVLFYGDTEHLAAKVGMRKTKRRLAGERHLQEIPECFPDEK